MPVFAPVLTAVQILALRMFSHTISLGQEASYTVLIDLGLTELHNVRDSAAPRSYVDWRSRAFSTVAERYIRVFRSLFAVRRHLCLAFYVRASRFAVRASRFAVRSHLCLAFHVRASRVALSHSPFVLSRSCFAVRSSWFAVSAFFVRSLLIVRVYILVRCRTSWGEPERIQVAQAGRQAAI